MVAGYSDEFVEVWHSLRDDDLLFVRIRSRHVDEAALELELSHDEARSVIQGLAALVGTPPPV